MKVAIVVHKFPQLSETFIINQITALLDAGVEVKIFSYYRPEPSQKLHPQFKDYNLQSLVHYGEPLPTSRKKKFLNFVPLLFKAFSRHRKIAIINSLNFFAFGKKVFNLMYFYRSLLFERHNEFDIIHCHFGPIGHDVVQLKRMGLVKGKIITSFHGYDFQRNDILKEYENYKLLFLYGDGFISNSNFTYKSLLRLGCETTKLTIIPVSTSSKVFSNKQSKKTAVKDFTILSIARLEEVKGVEYAIRAINQLKKKNSLENIKYNIIGSGSLEAELKNLANELQLGSNVNFLGSKTQDEVYTKFLDSNVFLLTSVTTKAGASEAQGLVLLEAQSVGLPVIASNTGGVPESLIDGETGILVPEKDVAAIASAILNIYENPERSRKMGEKGKAFIKAEFDQKFLCSKMLIFYKYILNNYATGQEE